jgi:hypothetical protein
MSEWTTAELDAIGASDELRLASRRADGSLRPDVTIWVVRVGPELYVRSAYGAGNPWYRRALASGTGHIGAGGVEADVAFEAADDADASAIDAEYHAKYDRYGARIVNPVVGQAAASVTLRLVRAAD